MLYHAVPRIHDCNDTSTWREKKKKTHARDFNNFRLVIITSILCNFMQVEGGTNLIATAVADNMNTLQFAPLSWGWGWMGVVEDATATLQHLILSHLGQTQNISRVLLMDFSSALNT